VFLFLHAGDNDTVVYLEEVPLQAFPMFEGITLLSTLTQNVALLASAHKCVTDCLLLASHDSANQHLIQPLN